MSDLNLIAESLMSINTRLVLSLTTAASLLTACSDSSTPVATTAAARAFAIAGHGQHVIAGGLTTDTLILQVTDADGAPLAGVSVSWSADAAGTLLEPAQRTDQQGRAQAIFTAGTKVASARIAATASGVEPVVFEVQIDPAAASQLQAMAPLSDTLEYGQAYTGGGIKVLDQFGNAVPGIDFTAQLIDASESLLGYGVSGSDSNGIVRVPFTVAPDVAGSYTLRFENSALRMQYGITVLAPVDSSASSLRRSRP
jgi:hypothetical protein